MYTTNKRITHAKTNTISLSYCRLATSSVDGLALALHQLGQVLFFATATRTASANIGSYPTIEAASYSPGVDWTSRPPACQHSRQALWQIQAKRRREPHARKSVRDFAGAIHARRQKRKAHPSSHTQKCVLVLECARALQVYRTIRRPDSGETFQQVVDMLNAKLIKGGSEHGELVRLLSSTTAVVLSHSIPHSLCKCTLSLKKEYHTFA